MATAKYSKTVTQNGNDLVLKYYNQIYGVMKFFFKMLQKNLTSIKEI